MPHALKAIYRHGMFILQTTCDLPEGIEVELFVKSPEVIPPRITDVGSRQDFLRLLVERMQQNPIPSNAPRFTRDMLHERRTKHENLSSLAPSS
jgi:predicted DNA-binding antitoxin AbrB/MazE fold protein